MKTWKLLQLAGVLLLLLGVVVRVGGEYYGTVMAVFGVLLFAVGRIMAWLRSDGP